MLFQSGSGAGPCAARREMAAFEDLAFPKAEVEWDVASCAGTAVDDEDPKEERAPKRRKTSSRIGFAGVLLENAKELLGERFGFNCSPWAHAAAFHERTLNEDIPDVQ